jgi:NDP-sugar pyrophosphorylase family protein
MALPRVILLAAGQGSRLGELTRDRPKSLLPVDGEPLLLRTVRQLWEHSFRDVTIVVGHMQDRIERALAPWGDRVRCVPNPRYATDTNIGSLLCGLGGTSVPALIIEADIAFDDEAIASLARVAQGDESVWFTNGSFRSYRLGGCLKADAAGRLVDLRYVPANGPEFADYRKLLGVVYAAEREMPRFHQLLQAAAARSTAQYYMMPWCEHLAQLPARDCDLSHCRTATFNTPEEYARCLDLFSPSTTAHAC